MRISLFFLLAAVLLAAPLSAKKTSTTRSRLKPAATTATTPPRDSVMAVGSEAMTLRGYDKPLRSRKESLFVTNTLAVGVSRVHLTINYLDMEGRQLHSAARWIDTDIPAGQTRQVAFPSWDTQQSFYYHLSRSPKTQAAPYRITAAIDSVAITPDLYR